MVITYLQVEYVFVLTSSIDQNRFLSDCFDTSVIVEMIWRRVDEVASDNVVGIGPDNKYPSLDLCAVGPLPLIISSSK